jgi:TetR/AcrR family transcriptional repressor of nem operon
MALNETAIKEESEEYQKDSTKYQIIRTALTFMATKTYNSFSINDIAKKLGMTKSSIYYHFKSKEEIGLEALKLRGSRIKRNMMNQRNRNAPPQVKIKEIFDYFFKVNDLSICPGASLSVDFENIPESIQNELTNIFSGVIKYFEEILIEGKNQGEFSFEETPEEKSELLFSLVEGTLLVARSMQDFTLYDKITNQMLYSLLK